MKYLGIDYGTRKIGIATSDEMGNFAFPKAIMPNDPGVLEAIVALCVSEKIEAIVIGDSIATNEVKNEVSGAIETFKTKLQEKILLPVYLEREDFSSVEAHRYQTKKGDRDDSAAAIILQRFLDKHKGE